MPYPFAHPAAAVPLCRLLGPLAVPSALVIGSIAPDLWFLAPFVDREQSHSPAGIFWFDLPMSLFLYAAFHLLFKEPLLSLLPRRLAAPLAGLGCFSLPRVSWLAVAISVVAASAAHLGWDVATHTHSGMLARRVFAIGEHRIHLHQVLQHASTLFGSLFLIWWTRRKLAGAVPGGLFGLAAPWRVMIAGALLGISAAIFAVILSEASPATADLGTVRMLLRAAGVTAASTFGFGLLAYSVLWRMFKLRDRISV